ncbi:hypothetical protein HK15_13965 [Acetobacter orientalis]|uniref:Uncharacterized protein n=1 Tax=Acetobacter orientalis TaxID=146474 RepID=A0A252B1V2_9PROT|nr:hypothetical protein HK15_13965 [Acetobacter orientalis]
MGAHAAFNAGQIRKAYAFCAYLWGYGLHILQAGCCLGTLGRMVGKDGTGRCCKCALQPLRLTSSFKKTERGPFCGQHRKAFGQATIQGGAAKITRSGTKTT